MCYIICMTKPTCCVVLGAWEASYRGVVGGGAKPLKNGIFLHLLFSEFRHTIFTDGFLILVKELGL
jgi:hypothetical protein